MTTYTKAIALKFCQAVAEGNRSIRRICAEEGMPSKASVFRWLAEYPEFVQLYEKAKDEAIHTHVDEAVDIADNCAQDPDAIRKARLQIDARIETAQLLRPKKYGKQLQLTGEGGGPIVHKAVTQLSDDELLAIAGREQSNAKPDPKAKTPAKRKVKA
jgi:hypothetical protein